jgi:hypothetical protein
MWMRAIALVLLGAAPAAAATPPVMGPSAFLHAVDAMMTALAPDSARAGATIRRVYEEHLALLMLDEYSELAGALDNGGLVPLPGDAGRFNILPRLDGEHPIGEKDLVNQRSYIAARPATIGVLLDVASRVQSGPIEITSLVRHSHYQDALRATNANATTSVPMHAMGLAFDIGLVNAKLTTVYEIRDVLLRMQADGDILFIGERQQLVFHVVPHPSRLGHYTDFYMQAVGAPPTSRSAHVVAYSSRPGAAVLRREPSVTADVVAVIPAEGAVQDWWTDLDDPVDASSASAAERPASEVSPFIAVERWLVLFAGLVATTWRVTARRGPSARLFEQQLEGCPELHGGSSLPKARPIHMCARLLRPGRPGLDP